MGLCQLMLRDFENGWKSYYDTLGVKHREARDYGVPDWDGKSSGKIVVYGEQGVGDEIMFSSCIPELIKDRDIIIDCDKRLESLFKRSFDCPVYGTRFKKETPLLDEHKPEWQCAIGQLPYLLKRFDEDSYPGTPYLIPNDDHVVMYRALFDRFKGKKIGLAWNGGLNNTGKKYRSFTLDDLSPLIDDRNTYISLDYKEPDLDKLNEYSVKSYPSITGKGKDIDELAGMVSQLDFVITCCTTIVYVAGALGVPCYVMVPQRCGYRYHIEGQFPWYKSVRLFRQRGDDWSNVCEQIKNEINKC